MSSAPSTGAALKAGPSTRGLVIITWIIVVVLLLVVIAEGFVINEIVQGSTNKSLSEAISIIAIIVLIVALFALGYVAYAIGVKAKTCA
jgi:hypothetical protein